MTAVPDAVRRRAAKIDKMAPAPLPVRDYVYDATLDRIVDGDTVVLLVDLGGRVYARWEVRLRGYDAPAKRSKPGVAGIAHLRSLLDGQPLRVVTWKDEDDRYGRLLGRLWRVVDGREIAPEMVRAGFGVVWDGTGGHPEQEGRER